MKLKNITIFCASSIGNDAEFKKQAFQLGEAFAERKIKLIYGGGQVGLMGAIADGALSKQGEVVGVIPHFLNSKEIGHSGVTELIAVDSMHQRKTIMSELCDGFIALPGGFGTMEELFEIITWGQLGLHQKPVGLLNINGFYDHLIQFLEHMVATGLLKKENYDMLLIADNLEALLFKMENYQAQAIPKWISISKT